MTTPESPPESPIERLMADTEPSGFQVGEYIQKPRAEPTAVWPHGVPGQIVSDLESAGYTEVFDTITREPSIVNNNMLLAQLAVKREDGSRVFTTIRPAIPPWRGSIKCFLHKDMPDWPRYEAMGFKSCRKATLPNIFEAEEHARNRHRNQWRAVEAEREAKERQEDRAVQRQMAEALVETASTGHADGRCPHCLWRSSAGKRGARRSSLDRHISLKHPND
jgi:hypothetical protein